MIAVWDSQEGCSARGDRRWDEESREQSYHYGKVSREGSYGERKGLGLFHFFLKGVRRKRERKRRREGEVLVDAIF